MVFDEYNDIRNDVYGRNEKEKWEIADVTEQNEKELI